MNRKRSDFCSTCGKPRGTLEPRRESWGLDCRTAMVPRSDDPTMKPWQISNDLIFNAAVWRNGGTSEESHLCDDCLRIGLRAIKLEVDRLLESVEAGADKDAEIATLTQRLGSLQLKFSNMEYGLQRDAARWRFLCNARLFERHDAVTLTSLIDTHMAAHAEKRRA